MKGALVFLAISTFLLSACSAAGHKLSGSISNPTCFIDAVNGSMNGTTAAGPSEGDQVLIRDGDGKVLATAQLASSDDHPAGECLYTWEAQVPDADFYQFKIGETDGPTKSRAELTDLKWVLELVWQ